MRSFIKNRYLLLATFVVAIFYSFILYFYSETILNGDAGYTYLQLTEFLRGNHFDLIYKGVRYCSVIEPVIAFFLKYLFPLSVALPIGVLSYYIAGYFLLRHRFQPKQQAVLLLILTLALPNPAYQALGALGAHNIAVFFTFVFAHLLSHPRYRTIKGDYRLAVYFTIALLGGFSIFTYVLAKTVAYSAALTLFSFYTLNQWKKFKAREIKIDKNQLKSLLIRAGIVWIGFRVGLLPRKITLHFFNDFHLGGGTPPPVFSQAHWTQKFNNFLELLSHQYTAVFQHSWTSPENGLYSHANYPLHDVLNHHSDFGIALGIAILMLTLVTVTMSLLKKMDPFRFFWVASISALLLSYFARGEFSPVIAYESRYLLILYFGSLILLWDLQAEARKVLRYLCKASVISVLLLAASSHFIIFKTNLHELGKLRVQKNCVSLAQSEVYQVVKKLNPEALVGTYWEVWTLAAFLDQRHVYDLDSNRFSYSNDQTFHRKLTMVFSSQALAAKSDEEVFKNLVKIPGPRSFTKTQLGAFNFFFENDSVHTTSQWEKNITEAVAVFGKTPCATEEQLIDFSNNGEEILSRAVPKG